MSLADISGFLEVNAPLQISFLFNSKKNSQLLYQMSDKQFVQKKVQDLMAWFRTKYQSYVEDHLRNLVSNKAKKQYQESSQLIVSEF